MKVDDFVDRALKRLVVVAPTLNLHETAEKLDQSGIDLLVVVGEEGRSQGVVTDSDLVSWIAGGSGKSSDATAGSVMTRDVFSCTADQVLGSVVSQAVDRGLKHFPILSRDAQPLGVIYVSDALIALHKEDQLSTDTLLEYIHGGGYR